VAHALSDDINHRLWMAFKVSENQYGRPHPSDSWAFCFSVAENEEREH